jgi:hypothetical protein
MSYEAELPMKPLAVPKFGFELCFTICFDSAISKFCLEISAFDPAWNALIGAGLLDKPGL